MREAVALFAVLLVLADTLFADQPAPKPSPTPVLRRPPLRERLRYPLGRPRALGRGYEDAPLLRFEESVEVKAPPLDFVRLRAEWTRHWNLAGDQDAPSGVPTHSDLRDHSRELQRLSGVPTAQGASFLPLALAAGQAIAKRLARKPMPPAPPPPAPTPTPVPLTVWSGEEEDEAEAAAPTAARMPGVSPTPTPTPAQSKRE